MIRTSFGSEWKKFDDLAEFLDLEDPHHTDRFAGVETTKLVRWDNYIDPFLALYRNVERASFSVHQEGRTLGPNLRRLARRVDKFREYSFASVLLDLETLFEGYDTETKGIINFDLDYFSLFIGDKFVTPFADTIVVEIFRAIRCALPKTHVLTIALSPDCCAGTLEPGWAEAERLCALACRGLEIDFVLPTTVTASPASAANSQSDGRR